MTETPYIVCFVTAKDAADGDKIARSLLDQKLAACVNISANVQSLFWWEGKVDTAEEVLLIIKSEQRLLDKIVAAVKAAHSYDVPEVIALPIVGGNADYLNWVRDSVKEGSSK